MENRYLRIIEALVRHRVDFIVVGGIAAVLQRVPINTQDFDLVHNRVPENVERLLAALADLDAIYRHDPRKLRPNASHLLGPGNQLLQTANIDFDVLGRIDFGGDYQDLLPDTEIVDVGGHSVRILTLERLIQIKRQLTRPKDKFMLVQLEATFEEREKARKA